MTKAERDPVVASKECKARKTHVCSLCGRNIEKGEIYSRVAVVFDDKMSTMKFCNTVYGLNLPQ